MDCLFCKIIEKQIPASIVYEDGRVVAFNDINPQAPTHVLVVPKEHIATPLDIADEHNELIGHMFQVAANIAKERGIAERGFRALMNCNAEAGQSVFHIHLHILGGRPMQWPPG
jgi:histidine triad (HIT) family protein